MYLLPANQRKDVLPPRSTNAHPLEALIKAAQEKEHEFDHGFDGENQGVRHNGRVVSGNKRRREEDKIMSNKLQRELKEQIYNPKEQQQSTHIVVDQADEILKLKQENELLRRQMGLLPPQRLKATRQEEKCCGVQRE
eukprot:jgi/Bigna1/134459/aug1.25_g9167